ncbi:MAG: pilus assembly protein TadG-related protein [Burkholderiaceae bacterium]
MFTLKPVSGLPLDDRSGQHRLHCFRQGGQPKGCQQRLGQSGQVLLFALALLMVGASGLLLMFDVGQAVNTKSRLVNAADASAYSAAAWRARVFNYMAYSNRAIIAQEVAVAQAVTLDSWSQYFAGFTRNVNGIAAAYPPAAAITQAIASAAQLAQTTTAATAATEIRLRDAPRVGYKTLLQHSQRVLRTAAGTFGASAVANEVARASDSRFFAFALPDNDAYQKFARRYESDADRQRLKTLVTRSMDPFTGGPRGENQTLVLPASCLLLSPSPSDWFQRYRKRGGTVLADNGLDRWESADTGSLHDSKRRRFSRLCRRTEVMPMGWGAAEVVLEPGVRRLTANPGDIQYNARATANDQRDFASNVSASYRGTGIARVFDLNYSALADNRYPSSRVVVLASVNADRLKISEKLRVGSGRLAKAGRWAGGKLWALAAAEVYFKRPPLAPAKTEYASLYNPYWQVRLVAPDGSDAQQAAGYGAQ